MLIMNTKLPESEEPDSEEDDSKRNYSKPHPNAIWLNFKAKEESAGLNGGVLELAPAHCGKCNAAGQLFPCACKQLWCETCIRSVIEFDTVTARLYKQFCIHKNTGAILGCPSCRADKVVPCDKCKRVTSIGCVRNCCERYDVLRHYCEEHKQRFCGSCGKTFVLPCCQHLWEDDGPKEAKKKKTTNKKKRKSTARRS